MNLHARIDAVSCKTLLTVALDGVDRVAKHSYSLCDSDSVAATTAEVCVRGACVEISACTVVGAKPYVIVMMGTTLICFAACCGPGLYLLGSDNDTHVARTPWRCRYVYHTDSEQYRRYASHNPCQPAYSRPVPAPGNMLADCEENHQRHATHRGHDQHISDNHKSEWRQSVCNIISGQR